MSRRVFEIFRWGGRESVIFVRRFSALVAGVIVFSLPAIVVTVGLIPNALVLLVGGIVTIAISQSRRSIVNPDADDEQLRVNLDDMSDRELLIFVIVVYTTFAAGVSVVLILGTTIAASVLFVSGSGTAALLVAVLFPLVDQQMPRYTDNSLFEMTTFAVLTLFDLVAPIYRVSDAVLDQAWRRRRRMIS